VASWRGAQKAASDKRGRAGPHQLAPGYAKRDSIIGPGMKRATASGIVSHHLVPSICISFLVRA
jgi:hypothetical protein